MLELITDRTQQDVDSLRELTSKRLENMTAAEITEWLKPHKGAYNYTDLNRVEAAVAYLGERLNQHGYHIGLLETKVWGMNDVPTLADMARYLTNVRQIRFAFVTLDTTPAAPLSLERMTYQSANNIEQILHDVDVLLNNMILSMNYSGEIYGGEL